MIEKEKIGAFVAYHNIIRPIEYPLNGLVFAATLVSLFFGRFSISQPDKASQSTVSYIGLGVSIILMVLSIVIRKQILKKANIEPGKSLYLSQMLIYIYCAIVGELFIFAIVGFEYGEKEALFSVCISLFFTIIVAVIAYFCLIWDIRKGHYVEKNKILNERLIAISSSVGGVGIFLIFFQFIKTLFRSTGYIIVSIMLAGISSVLAFSYFLKLWYVRKYDLEKYLPERPHPSRYTSFQ